MPPEAQLPARRSVVRRLNIVSAARVTPLAGSTLPAAQQIKSGPMTDQRLAEYPNLKLARPMKVARSKMRFQAHAARIGIEKINGRCSSVTLTTKLGSL